MQMLCYDDRDMPFIDKINEEKVIAQLSAELPGIMLFLLLLLLKFCISYLVPKICKGETVKEA